MSHMEIKEAGRGSGIFLLRQCVIPAVLVTCAGNVIWCWICYAIGDYVQDMSSLCMRNSEATGPGTCWDRCCGEDDYVLCVLEQVAVKMTRMCCER